MVHCGIALFMKYMIGQTSKHLSSNARLSCANQLAQTRNYVVWPSGVLNSTANLDLICTYIK